MNPGKLTHLVKIQRPVLSAAADSGGQAVASWKDVATVWASIVPLTGREYYSSAQVQSDVSHTITIRYRSGIDATMRILWGTREFYFESVINENEQNRWLIIRSVEYTT